MNVNYDTYKSEDFICNQCGWQGKGTELTHGDFSESDLIGDLNCPNCIEMIAHWQAPLKEDT